MAHAGRVFGRPEWIASARRALEFIRAAMWRERQLLATYKDGRAHLNAYLDDYAFLHRGAARAPAGATSRPTTSRSRPSWPRCCCEQFEDAEAGGFFFTARDHERLIHRPKPGHDNATPSGNAVAAWALGAARRADRRRALRPRGGAHAGAFLPAMRDHPAGYAAMAIALDEQLVPPKVLVLRGADRGAARAGAKSSRASTCRMDWCSPSPDGAAACRRRSTSRRARGRSTPGCAGALLAWSPSAISVQLEDRMQGESMKQAALFLARGGSSRRCPGLCAAKSSRRSTTASPATPSTRSWSARPTRTWRRSTAATRAPRRSWSHKVKKGGAGRLGPGADAAQRAVPDADIKALVKWILSQK